MPRRSRPAVGARCAVEALHALKNMTVGVVGFGRIGREVAAAAQARSSAGFSFATRWWRRRRFGPPAASPVGFDELLASSDLVTLHCPSNAQDAIHDQCRKAFLAMKRGVMLVNTSRGTLVKTDDLVAALKSGQMSAAALDVTDPEPIPSGHPLVKMDNVIITAHIASASPQCRAKLRTDGGHLSSRWPVRGEQLPNIVNGVKP